MSDQTPTPQPLPTTAKTVLVFANPTAGSGSRRAALEQLCRELSSRQLEPRRIDSLNELASESATLQAGGQLRAIVSAGGDGTAAEIANRTSPSTPIAIFPMGTANLLAGYLDISHDPTRMAHIISQGHVRFFDAGRANGRLFLLMAGIGFDAEVVHRVHSARTGNIRGWAYAKPIWQAIRNYQYPPLRVYCARNSEVRNREVGASGVVAGPIPSAGNDYAERHSAGLGGELMDHSWPQRATTEAAALAGSTAASEVENDGWLEPIACRWAFVFNISRYAGGLNFAPAANGCDGQLDWCTFQHGGLLAGLKYLGAIVRGRHPELPECITGCGVRFRIESDQPVPYELDGDPGGMLPLTIEIVPQRLCLLVPENWPPASIKID
ncbi:MAG TPA: diacylglycerol kinase family protein [Pirellulales bacterium]|nr:diacylglycerol kinase family protein [Pirellulales bacterium]